MCNTQRRHLILYVASVVNMTELPTSGNLFSGILSGQLYGKLARDMQRPDLMWIEFGGVMLLTALAFWLYNVFALPKSAADTMTNKA